MDLLGGGGDKGEVGGLKRGCLEWGGGWRERLFWEEEDIGQRLVWLVDMRFEVFMSSI